MNYTLVYTSPSGSVEFSLDSGIVIEKFDSPGKMDVEFTTSTGSKNYGVKVESQRVQPRTLTITGTIIGDAREKKKKLVHVLAPMQMGTLQYNGEYYMSVYPKQSPVIESRHINPRFSFMLYAPMPYWRNSGGTSAPMYGVEGLFSFPWNWGSEFQFSGIRKGTVNVVNDGDAPCTWELTVIATGEVQNPRITKKSTEEYVQVNVTLTDGQKLIVSTDDDEMTVLMVDENGTESNVFSYLDIESSSFYLDVGDNLLDFTPHTDNVQATIHFRKNYAGVQ